jgi:GntR family transcriptional regulator, transcriptional repressor for pyruvate dehydrogenase complex
VVRQAIHSLAGKGLVIARQGVGTMVAEDANSGLLESFRWTLRGRQVTQTETAELMSALESSVVALASCHRDTEDLARLRRIIDEFDRLPRRSPWEQVLAFRLRFMRCVVAATHNRAITALLEPLLELLYSGAQPDGAVHEATLGPGRYQRIYERIEAGESESDLAGSGGMSPDMSSTSS